MIKNRIISVLNVYFYAFIAGALCDLSFAPFHLFLAAIISISGFFILINQPDIIPQKSFKIGWFYGFGYFFAGIYWIAISLLVEAAKFAWLIPFALILIPGFLAGYFALIGFFYQKIISKFQLNQSQKIIIFSLLWLISELLRSYLFSGFAWNLIGYSWLFSDRLSQLSAIFGIYGLSLFAVLVCLTPTIIINSGQSPLSLQEGVRVRGKYWFVRSKFLPSSLYSRLSSPLSYLSSPRRRGSGFSLTWFTQSWISAFAGIIKRVVGMTKRTPGSSIFYIIFITIFLIISFLYGHFRINKLSADLSAINDPNTPKIRIIQANIKQDSKWDQFLILQNLKKHIELSNSKSTKNIAAIIWSETSMPYILNDNLSLISYLQSTVIKDNTVLISGALRAKFDQGKMTKIWNSIYVIDHQGISNFYDKNHLVPFGEYVPFSEFFSLVTKINIGNIDFSSGNKSKIIKTKYFSFAPLICYEIIFSTSLYEITKNQNPDLIINLTNDAWFGSSSGPYQHFDMARMRAIEYGMPLIRVANTGISGAFDALGRVIAKIELNQGGVVDIDIPKKLNGSTIYASYGFKPLILLMISLCGFWIAASRQSRRARI